MKHKRQTQQKDQQDGDLSFSNLEDCDPIEDGDESPAYQQGVDTNDSLRESEPYTPETPKLPISQQLPPGKESTSRSPLYLTPTSETDPSAEVGSMDNVLSESQDNLLSELTLFSSDSCLHISDASLNSPVHFSQEDIDFLTSTLCSKDLHNLDF